MSTPIDISDSNHPQLRVWLTFDLAARPTASSRKRALDIGLTMREIDEPPFKRRKVDCVVTSLLSAIATISETGLKFDTRSSGMEEKRDTADDERLSFSDQLKVRPGWTVLTLDSSIASDSASDEEIDDIELEHTGDFVLVEDEESDYEGDSEDNDDMSTSDDDSSSDDFMDVSKYDDDIIMF